MRKLLALMICMIAAILPYRLRISFAHALGWFAQAVGYLYFSVMRIIVRNLQPKEGSQ